MTAPAERVLDWRSRHDERSLMFGVAQDLDWGAPLRDKTWRRGPVLDQGKEGACVGYGCSGELAAQPAPVRGVTNATALAFYRDAQRIDEWPGEDYSGTSVLAGMKTAMQRGYYSGYHWCFDVDQMARTVVQLGPVVIGVPWRSGMYDTGPDGVVQVEGSEVGGHCLVVIGYRRNYKGLGPCFVWLNSWGPTYGLNGRGFVRKDDMATLLAKSGECAVPHDRTSGRTV